MVTQVIKEMVENTDLVGKENYLMYWRNTETYYRRISPIGHTIKEINPEIKLIPGAPPPHKMLCRLKNAEMEELLR